MDTYIHITRPTLVFEIGENPNSYPNLVKATKTHQIGVGLGC